MFVRFDKILSAVTFTSLAIIGVWVIGFIIFVSRLPTQIYDKFSPTDAIVVLTGDKDRIPEGVALLSKGYAPKLLISGVNPKSKSKVMARLYRARINKNRIKLGYDAGTTIENAEETEEWIMLEDMQSIRLVTSHYHMPRSLLEFRNRLPELKIIPHPVFPKKQKKWWFSRRGFRLVFLEYNKSIIAHVRQKIS